MSLGLKWTSDVWGRCSSHAQPGNATALYMHVQTHAYCKLTLYRLSSACHFECYACAAGSSEAPWTAHATTEELLGHICR